MLLGGWRTSRFNRQRLGATRFSAQAPDKQMQLELRPFKLSLQQPGTHLRTAKSGLEASDQNHFLSTPTLSKLELLATSRVLGQLDLVGSLLVVILDDEHLRQNLTGKLWQAFSEGRCKDPRKM